MKIEWQIDWLEPEPGILTLLQTAADAAMAAQGINTPCSVSLRLTNDAVIHQINREYRNIDRATDILSFPMTAARPDRLLHDGSPMLRRVFDPEEGCCYLGDLVMSMDHVKMQAEEYGSGLSREAAYLLVHGLCHLMGYDHMMDADKKEMRQMEEKAMAMMGLSQEENAKVTKEDLMALARAAMDRAYVPYSHFRVGAALLCKDGRVFQGCNIENSSYGATNCGERTAVFKAVSEGAREFEAIAIASDNTAPWPCGICRQVLSEFAPDIKVYLTWNGGADFYETSLPELLPHHFGPKDLDVKV
ncbi:MAG: cytidine deaminase [Clostridia bacterium]|nr:cytidine deaminase [Clostridia bacterium]